MKRLLSALAITAALGGSALADMSKKVIGSFKGQLVVSTGELPEGKDDKDTVAKIKAANQTSLTGEQGDEVTIWNFHFTAFLKATGASSLELEFWEGKTLKANKRLSGVDTKQLVIQGDITVDEDEGLTKGKSYTIKIVTDKDIPVAVTKPIAFK